VVLDRKADLVHQFNRTAAFIWQRCEGQATRQDIVAQLVEAFEVDPDAAAASVTVALRQFQELGLLENGQA
jgi:hypothetical protein